MQNRLMTSAFLAAASLCFAGVPSKQQYIPFYDNYFYEAKQYLASAGLTDSAPTGYVPFTISNNSKVADTSIYILVLTNNFYNIITFAPNADGLMLGSVATPPPKTYVSQAGSGTYTLSQFFNSSTQTYTFYIPSTVNLNASRIYYSVGQPLDWFIPYTGPVLVPAQDFSDPAQDGYYILFDKQEFTMDANDRLIMNPTLVDYYGLPLSFSISYLDYTQTVPTQTVAYAGLPPTLSSSQIFTNYTTAVATLPTTPGTGVQSVWDTMYLTYQPPSGSSGPLRVLSSNQGIQTQSPLLTNPLFPINYFLSPPYISCDWLENVWYNMSNNATYQLAPLYIDLSTSGPAYGIAQGQVDMSGNFNFTAISGQGMGSTLTLPLPTSSKAFFTSTLTDYTPAPMQTGDNNVATAIWQALSAGVISGVIPLTGTSVSAPLSQSFIRKQSLFQNNTGLPCNGPWYDFYSGTFISMGSGNYVKFYTTPYADFLGTDGTVTVTQIANANAQVTVNIGDMSGIAIPDPFNDMFDYTVIFNPLPANVFVTFGSNPNPASNPSVMAGGQTFMNVPGATMYLGVTYATNNYTGQTWTTHLIPSAPAPKPVLPGGLSLSLAGGPGGTLTITLGGPP